MRVRNTRYCFLRTVCIMKYGAVRKSCLLDIWLCERVRLSVIFEGHCFSPLESSLAVSGLICRQVF